MKNFLIFDGPSPNGIELNQREQRFKKALELTSTELELKSISQISLLEYLITAPASICFIHHSELKSDIGPNNLPHHHFYVHYSGAGFSAVQKPWADLANHIFFGDSVDAKDLDQHDGLLGLIKACSNMTPTLTPEHWRAQLKTIALVPYLNRDGNLCSHFPKQLAEAFLLEQGDSGQREELSSWAKNKSLSDNSTPSPLTIEKAWQIYAQSWRKKKSVTSDFQHTAEGSTSDHYNRQQQNLALAHDSKRLIFSLKAKDYEKLTQNWRAFYQHDLRSWLKENPNFNETLELNKVESWILSRQETELLRVFKNLRTQLKSEHEHETAIIKPETTPDHLNLDKLLSIQDLKQPASSHSPIVWSVGPNAAFASEFFTALANGSKTIPQQSTALRPQRFAHDNLQHLEEVLQHLRAMSCQEVFHTLLVIDVGANLKETLNAGHKNHHLSLSAKWTHDQNLQLGLLARMALTFPHLSLAVIHQHQPKDLRDILTQELLLSIPEHTFSPSGLSQNNLIDHLIEHHFFSNAPEATETTETHQRLQQVCMNFFEGKRTLFDPTGLRTLFKCRLIANIFSGTTEHGQPDLQHTETQRTVLCSRLKNLLVSVDEDNSSTLFHAYAGYRFGYRAWTITSFHQFDDESIWRSPSENKLVLRDTDLRFPDIDGREPHRGPRPSSDQKQLNVRQRLESIYSDLWQYLPSASDTSSPPNNKPVKVDESWNVRVIAAGGSNIRTKPWIGSSPEERQWGEVKNAKEPGYLLGLRKPLRSLFDLSQLMSQDQATKTMTIASQLVSPKRLQSKQGHYAPYINLPLAAELLAQAKTLKDDDELDWLLGSILALEADEILLGMSEYTGLDAVRHLHRCEVKAEIRSVGFSGMIRIKPRKQELNHLVRTRYENDELSQDHFLSRLWDDLRTLYKGAEQFHAAEEANIEGFCKRKWLSGVKALHPIEELLRRCFILSASSIWMWSASLCFSTLILWSLYSIFLPPSAHSPLGFQILVSSLIGEPALGLELLKAEDMGLGLRITMLTHYGTSYILFGFFLSMIYRRITRS